MDTSERQAHLAAKLQTISKKITDIDESTKILGGAFRELIETPKASLHAMNHTAILRTLRPAIVDKRFEEIRDPGADSFAWSFQELASHDHELHRCSVSGDFRMWLRGGLRRQVDVDQVSRNPRHNSRSLGLDRHILQVKRSRFCPHFISGSQGLRSKRQYVTCDEAFSTTSSKRTQGWQRRSSPSTGLQRDTIP
ncbi:hypothetical protein B0T21DRAFT_48572 [Apiosordaria backusii]|uniref:Uncharacterized protein n=1 Tax=Apiosordaria backusii TaxID=314023 RepID=A0AA40AXU8_9PEZI|nr:hypothetical protein B0T21DRAFT_48572 [Apiosordaria backusii]